jgi:hypothetical protein
MQNLPDLQSAPENFFRALRGEIANADHPFRLKRKDRLLQMLIASREQGVALILGKFVRSSISPTLLQESERTIVQNEMFSEELRGRSEAVGEKSPQTFSAYLRALAIEAGDQALRVLNVRFRNSPGYSQPVPDRIDFAEGHSGLHHSKRARIHAEEDNPLWALRELLDVMFVRFPGVLERVVDVGDRGSEAEAGDALG